MGNFGSGENLVSGPFCLISGHILNPVMLTAKKGSWFSVLQLFAAQFATLLLRIPTMLDIMQTGPGAKII